MDRKIFGWFLLIFCYVSSVFSFHDLFVSIAEHGLKSWYPPVFAFLVILWIALSRFMTVALINEYRSNKKKNEKNVQG